MLFRSWLPSSMRHRTLSSSPALWASIPCPRSELRLDLVLASGQSFRWKEQSPAHWSGVLADQVWTLTQTEDQLYCTVYRGDDSQVPLEPQGVVSDVEGFEVCPQAPTFLLSRCETAETRPH